MKDYKDQFLEAAAQPVSGPTFNEVTREGKLVRRWTTNIQQWEQAALLEQIRQRRYVDNPSCNRQGGEGDDYVPAGRWRQATTWVVTESGQIEPGLYEELRYGYLQPPSVSDSVPKPASTTSWAALD